MIDFQIETCERVKMANDLNFKLFFFTSSRRACLRVAVCSVQFGSNTHTKQDKMKRNTMYN